MSKKRGEWMPKGARVDIKIRNDGMKCMEWRDMEIGQAIARMNAAARKFGVEEPDLPRFP